MRRLTGDEHLGPEFTTTWRTYALDPKTRALLGYAEKLTEAPAMLRDADIDEMRAAGWDDRAIYEATALIAFYNFSDAWRPPPVCRWTRCRGALVSPKRQPS